MIRCNGPACPPSAYTSRMNSSEASRGAEGRCYVCFDAHRSDDDDPYVYMTEDYGQTWKSLRANLPWGSTRVLREDLIRECVRANTAGPRPQDPPPTTTARGRRN